MRTITDDIYTYDTERGATLKERVIRLYEFHELDDDAQARVIADYVEDRASDPYFGQYFADCYEYEIWECVHDLEKSIMGARVQWHYNRWYSCDFDCEYAYDDCYNPGYIEPVTDCGICYSMDLCDAWTKHARRLNGLYRMYEYLDYLCWDVYNNWNGWNEITENTSFFKRADALRDIAITRWYEELERACDDVRNEIETLLRGEWEWYTSDDCKSKLESNHDANGGRS